jgi:hypothetical protein
MSTENGLARQNKLSKKIKLLNKLVINHVRFSLGFIADSFLINKWLILHHQDEILGSTPTKKRMQGQTHREVSHSKVYEKQKQKLTLIWRKQKTYTHMKAGSQTELSRAQTNWGFYGHSLMINLIVFIWLQSLPGTGHECFKKWLDRKESTLQGPSEPGWWLVKWCINEITTLITCSWSSSLTSVQTSIGNPQKWTKNTTA